MKDVDQDGAPPPKVVHGVEAMRAAVLTGPRRAGLITTGPVPAPGEGEVLVRLEGCGICASNLVPWEGAPWMRYPTAPGALGHEGWGEVIAIGPGVQDAAPGQRVATLGQASFATHEIVPSRAVVALPTELDGLPFPGEAFACALNIFARAGIAGGRRVAIVGAGFLGLVLTRLAADAGAEVIVLSRSAEARIRARTQGADITLASGPETLEMLPGLTDGRLCDVVIEAVGSQEALDLAGRLVAEGGRLVIAGYHQDGPRLIDMQLWNWRGIDVINAHERAPEAYLLGLRRAIAAVLAGRLDPRDYVTHAFPLERLDAALEAARDKPAGFVKGYVTCR